VGGVFIWLILVAQRVGSCWGYHPRCGVVGTDLVLSRPTL